MPLLSKSDVIAAISTAIVNREILEVVYEHKDGSGQVQHCIAPFDIGSTNADAKVRERNANNCWVYSYTHVDKKTGVPKPMICGLDIHSFVSIKPTGATFDERELSRLHLEATRFDYRTYRFALLPDRDWFQR